MFTKEGMKTQPAKEGLAARQAELPKADVNETDCSDSFV
jgi:hypothetical protein